MNTQTKASKLRLMGFDVDGVLTDGSLYFTPQGDEIKAFSSLDGHGLKMLMDAGIEVAVITSRRSPMVEMRMKNLGITELHQGVKNKLSVLQQICLRQEIDLSQAGFMGDDLLDLPALAACGFAATPMNGYDFVKKHVDYIAQKQGGHGAVREVCDVILSAQGKLEKMLNSYLSAFK